MHWQEILRRITGLSIPIFGISWNPPEPDRAIARRVISQLENRRVLFNFAEYEYPKPCHSSVNEIRQVISTELGHLESATELAKRLRAIRRACLEFINTCELQGLLVDQISDYPYPAKHWLFIETLKRRREHTGIHVAAVAALYRIDVDEPLSLTLPPEPDELEP